MRFGGGLKVNTAKAFSPLPMFALGLFSTIARGLKLFVACPHPWVREPHTFLSLLTFCVVLLKWTKSCQGHRKAHLSFPSHV